MSATSSEPSDTAEGVTVKIFDNGPLVVRGACVISDQAGNLVTQSDGSSPVALCRCGESTTKPLCDGAHKSFFDGTLNPPAS